MKNSIVSNIKIDNAATYNKSLPMHIACDTCIWYSSIWSRTWFRAWSVPGILFLLGIKDIPKNRIGSNIEIDNAATYNKSLPMHKACDACILYSLIRSRTWFVPGVLFLLRIKDIPKNHIGSNNAIDNAATYNKSLPMHKACDACIWYSSIRSRT